MFEQYDLTAAIFVTFLMSMFVVFAVRCFLLNVFICTACPRSSVFAFVLVVFSVCVAGLLTALYTVIYNLMDDAQLQYERTVSVKLL